MFTPFREHIIARVKQRRDEGECPTVPPESVDMLEDVILDLIAGRPDDAEDAASAHEMANAFIAGMHAPLPTTPVASVIVAEADLAAIVEALEAFSEITNMAQELDLPDSAAVAVPVGALIKVRATLIMLYAMHPEFDHIGKDL